MMIRVDEEELDFDGEDYAEYQGVKFTGYSVEDDGDLINIASFVGGRSCGVQFSAWKESGGLKYYSNSTFRDVVVGGSYQWNLEGNLISEVITGLSWSSRVLRKWEESGALLSDAREKGVGHELDEQRLGLGFVPWMKQPRMGSIGNYTNWRFTLAVREGEARCDSLDERFRLRGESFWGYLVSTTTGGRTRMRQILDGREEGPVWEWSPVGKLVLQGVLHHPYGRVGPWHEWDETGRLLSETIYDALGNRIIDRRLDEVGNIAHEERYEPARLWRDPETGNERPAPWLWF